MVAIALLFLLAAVFAIPAFMVLGLLLSAAFFEGMSAITTTGLSMARDPDSWPFAAHVLRAWMQWCGGLAKATAVLALVLGPGPVAHEMAMVGIDDPDRLKSARAQARELLGAYTLLTVIFAVAIILALGRSGEGLVLALSAVSTGGFAPRYDSLASYDPFTQSIVILACVAGAVSLLAYAKGIQNGPCSLFASASLQRVVFCALGCAVALGAVGYVAGSQAGFFDAYLNILSALSTAGYSTSDMPASPALLVLFILAMVVCGDRGSTAGGIKLWRVAIAARATRDTSCLDPAAPARACRQPSAP